MSKRLISGLFLASLLLSGCFLSRYRLELFLTRESHTKKVKVEQAEFLERTVLDDPQGKRKVIPGPGNVIVVTTGTRWKVPHEYTGLLLGADDYLRYRLYLQLPPEVRKDSLTLANNSFVFLLGHYDLPMSSKVYFPQNGFFLIDSVTSKFLFGTIDGTYRSEEGFTLTFNGQFKVKHPH